MELESRFSFEYLDKTEQVNWTILYWRFVQFK
jgi:hypothetical protein